MIARLIKWLFDDAKRWSVALAIWSATVPVGLTFFTNSYIATKNRTEDLRLAEISGFFDTARQFDVFVAAFAQAILAQKANVDDAGQKLLENLVRQYQEVAVIRNYLPGSGMRYLTAYEEALLRLRQVMPQTSSVQTMAIFWEATSDVLVARNQLESELRKAAGMVIAPTA